MFFSYNNINKQYSYFPQSNPIITLDLTILKEHLRIDPSDNSQDLYLRLITKSAVKYAEKYTKRTFFLTDFITYRDSFNNNFFEIRRSPLQYINSIKYFNKNNDLITVAPDQYYVTREEFYAKILAPKNINWFSNITNERQQAVQIEFTAGYVEDFDDLPQDLQMALLNHINKLYEIRGDCDECTCATALPSSSKAIYDLYRIPEITGTMR